MSSPSDPQQPAARPQPSTREIPVVPSATTIQQLPPPSTGPQPAAAQPTGPVDFVPGLPGAGTPAPPPPVAPTPVAPEPLPPPSAPTPAPATGAPAEPAGPTWPESLDADPAEQKSKQKSKQKTQQGKAWGRRDPVALVGVGLAVLALLLLEVGLILDFGSESYWSTLTLWSAFATLATLLGVLAFAAFYPAGNAARSGPAWRVGAGGLVGLAAFWVLVVLPSVDSDRGFVLTAALAALGGALWIGPRRGS